MSYPDLNLDREKIITHLEKEDQEGISNKFEKKGNAYHCNFVADKKKALLIFHYKANGTTTVQFSVGKNPDLSKEFAKKIIENTKLSESKAISCTFKDITADEFDLFEEYIQEEIEGSKIVNKSDESDQIVIKVEGRENDQVTVTYYKTTGTTLLQGRPLPIFLETKTFFCTIVSQEQIIENENNVFDIQITKEEINSELAEYMPTAIGFLDRKIIKIITPALTLGKINVDLDDYSCFAFPALRGLEGYIKQLLKTNFKDYKNQQNIGSLFNKTKENGFKLQSFVDKEIGNPAIKAALETSYTLYYSKRHAYFHIDKGVTTSAIIEGKEVAQSLNLEILTTIESTYKETQC